MDDGKAYECGEIRIEQEVMVYRNSYGALYDDIVRFTESDSAGTYVRWRWASPYSVAVLPLRSEGTALLVLNYRHAARSAVLEAVKGFGADKEEPAAVAARELAEELGLQARHIEFVGTVVSDPGFTNHKLHLFIATELSATEGRPESTEVIQGVREVPLHPVAEYLRTGAVQDSVTLVLLEMAYDRTNRGRA